MEVVCSGADKNLRYYRVATFIQDSLKPAKHLLEEGLLSPLDEDIATEAKDFEVRDYQLEAWANLWEARKSGDNKALIHLATGLGKTSVAVFDVIKFREEFRAVHGRDPKALFTCHQNEIIEQAAERFAAFMPDATQGFYNGETKTLNVDLTFATLQSLYSTLGTFGPTEFDYIIYDEAHHSKAETFERVVTYFNPHFQLALTATPDRLDELDIREHFGKELYSKGLAQALAEGLLASPDYHIVFDEALKKAIDSGFEVNSLRELNELMSMQTRNEAIAENIKEEMAKIGLEFGTVKTIVFCQDIIHAEEMAHLLNGRAYHSGIQRKSDRRDILNNFRTGDLQVICTRDMFNEGVDIPDARLLVFLRSTSSQTVFEQQLGRGLRKFKGKEEVSVLDFVANIERILRVRELADQVRRFTIEQRDDVPDVDIEEEHTSRHPGFQIHTGHGDFDFDKLAVDLLDRFNVLREEVEKRLKFAEFTREDVIELALSISPDHPLTTRKIAELSRLRVFPGHKIINNLFGSIVEFQRACGYEMEALTNEELVDQALELKPEGPLTTGNISALSKEGKFISVSTVANRFGSIVEFQRACGFPPMDDLSNEEIISLALKLQPESPLKATQILYFSKKGMFASTSLLESRFGSIIKFQQACGFEVLDTRSMSNEDIIALAKEIKPHGPLTQNEIIILSKQGLFVSTRMLRDRFGGVNAFHAASGLMPEVPRGKLNVHQMSNDDLVELAKIISPDRPLTHDEIEQLSKERRFASEPTIVKRFGSLHAFRKACGFEVEERSIDGRKMSNEEIIALAIKLKPESSLTAAEMTALSKQGLFVGSATVIKRFGSVKNFQRACGFEV